MSLFQTFFTILEDPAFGNVLLAGAVAGCGALLGLRVLARARQVRAAPTAVHLAIQVLLLLGLLLVTIVASVSVVILMAFLLRGGVGIFALMSGYHIEAPFVLFVVAGKAFFAVVVVMLALWLFTRLGPVHTPETPA